MRDKIETIIQGKRHVARAVKQPDGKVAFHIYDFPDINGLPESRITKLASEFGLENSKDFIWYGREYFEKLYSGSKSRRNCMTGRAVITDALKDNQSSFGHYIPFAHVSHILGAHCRGVDLLEDVLLKQIVTSTQEHVEKRRKELAHQEQSMSIDEQRHLLNILHSVLPVLVPTEDK